MAKYMLLMHDDPQFHQAFAGMSQAEKMEIVKEFIAWNQKMREEGHYVGGEKLKEEPGRVLRKKGGKVEVRNGPYETGAVNGGTMIIEAKDYAEACGLAKTNPQLKYNGTIEVREIDQI